MIKIIEGLYNLCILILIKIKLYQNRNQEMSAPVTYKH
jgi:hypothetical protein